MACTKVPYRTQASARSALEKWCEARPDDRNVPTKVYPCDRCDGWHLTSKKANGKRPPWDKDPHWVRPPELLAKLEKRFSVNDVAAAKPPGRGRRGQASSR